MNVPFFQYIALCFIILITTQCGKVSVETTQPKGHLVMIGGGKRPSTVMKHIISLSTDSSFLVVPMASSIADTIGWEHRDMLKEYGAKEVKIMYLKESDSTNVDVIEDFRSAKGIWFSGGNQNTLMNYIGSSSISEAIREAYQNGAVIAGTSAGTAIQSSLMITGDERYPINDYVYFGQIRTGNVMVESGLGLVNALIVDQHFIRRRRSNRLITLLLDSGKPYALGIDESTALWLKPTGEGEIIGEGQALLWDASEATIVRRDSLLGAKRIQFHILPKGAKFQFQNEHLHSIDL